MNKQTLTELLAQALKKDRLSQYREKAEQGDEFAQYILGDIYFYGIDTDDEYWKNLEQTTALSQYSPRRDKYTFAFTCRCNREPDYEEALKWFKMAARNGNTEAQSKIEAIQSGTVKPSSNALIQLFRNEGNICRK